MDTIRKPRVESNAIGDFARVMQAAPLNGPRRPASIEAPRLNLDPNGGKNGIAQLVLTLIKLLHELLERQAIRRIDSGSLSEAEIERLGETLMKQAQEIERLRKEFGLEEDELNLDLGPIGRLL
ncbi:MAG: gas vesicle protein K [bacterium]|jgi:hypothetical protein|nr:gas vesicle protein K [bacterium]